MADDIKFDDDLDDDLGGDMMDFDLEAQNDDRNPATIFRQSALASVKTTVSDPSFVGDVVKKSLPTGYKSALDVADNIAGGIKTTYNESVQALKPSIDEFKRNAQVHIPKLKKILPDSVGNRVEEMLKIKPKMEDSVPSKEQMENAAMSSDLDKMFQVQAASVQSQQDQQAQDLLQNTITEERTAARHDANMTANERMINAFNRLVSYQDSITSQFQRRLLELNYRQYFAQRDLVDIARAGFTDLANALSAIVKNTALPDEAKVNLSETYADEARSRLAGQALDHVSTRIAGISQRVRSTLGQKVKQHVDNFKEGLNQGSALMATAESMQGLDGFGPKQTGGQKAADLAGSLVGDTIGERIGAKVSDLAGRTLGRNERVMAMSNRLQMNADNLPELLNQYARSTTTSDGVKGGIEDFLKSIIGTVGGDDGEVLHNLKQEALTATSFDIMTRRSIVEIIPGYLSRMLQQLEIFNNQDPNTERLQYSVDGEDFVRASTQADRVREAVFSTNDRERLSESTVDVINSIDPEDVLSADAKEAFSIQILTDLRNGRGYFPERYYKDSTFTEVSDSAVIDEIRDFVKERYTINSEGKVGSNLTATQNALKDNQAVKRLQDHLPNVQESVNEAVSVGDKDALRESGLIIKADDGVTDTVDSDALWSMIRSDITSTLDGREIESNLTTTLAKDTNSHSELSRSKGDSTTTNKHDATFNRVTGLSSTSNNVFNRNTNNVSSSSSEVNSQSDLLESIREIIDNNSQTSQSNNNLRERNYSLVSNNDQSSTSDIQRTINDNLKYLEPSTQAEVRGSIKAFTNEVDVSDTSESTLDVWSAIHETLIQGNGLTTALIARIDTWMNRDQTVDDAQVAGSDDPYIPYLMALQDKSVTSDTTLTDIKLILTDLSAKITTLGEGGTGDGSTVKVGLGGVLGKGLDLGKSAVTNTMGAVKSYYGGLFNLGGSALSTAKNTVMGGVNFVGNKLGNMPGDLYIAGQQIPTLLGSKLKQGKYIDEATGKVIQSAKDITGAVRDIDTGEIVLSVEDYAKGLFNRDGVSKLTGAAKSIIKAPVDFIQGYYRGLYGIGEMAVKGVANVTSGIENMLNRHGDVYVKGEDGPRLLKILLDKGMYYSSRTGEVIRSLKDIDGDVVDADGNVVLSVEDIKKGLVDESGRRIEVKSLLNRALEFGRDTLQAGVGMVTGAVKRTGKFLFGGNDDGTPQGGLFSRIGGMFSTITDNVKELFTRSHEMQAKEVIINSDLTKVFGPWMHGDPNDPDHPTTPPSGDNFDPSTVASNSAQHFEKIKNTSTYQGDSKITSVRADTLAANDSVFRSDNRYASSVNQQSKEQSYFSDLVQRGQSKATDLAEQTMLRVNEMTTGLYSQISENDTLNQNVVSLVDTTKDAYTTVSDKATDASLQVKDSVESLKETILDTFKKEKVLGDSDGDGIRDGSYLDQRNKETLAEKAKASIAKSAPGAAVLGGVAGFLGGLKDKIKGFSLFGDDEDDGSFFGDVAGDAASEIAGDAIGDQFDRDSREGRKARRQAAREARQSAKPGKRGIFSKIKSLGGRAMSGLGSLVKTPGRAILGAGTALAGMAGGAIKGVGGLAVKGASALGGAGSALATLGRVGLTVARVASGPVGWAATALWGAYKGAQYLNSRSDADPIEDMRFKQMGINTDEGAQLRAIRLLEEESLDNIEFNDRGEAFLPKVDYNDLIEEHGERFNVDKNNPRNLEAFVRWYEGTFKPTLLTYATLANRVEEDMDVDDLDDDLPEDQLVPFTKKAYELLESSPAIGNTSPYFDQTVTRSSVDEQYRRVMQEYGGEVDLPKGEAEVDTTTPTYTPPPVKEVAVPETVVKEPDDQLTRKLKAAAVVTGAGVVGAGMIGGGSTNTSYQRLGNRSNYRTVNTTALGVTMGGAMAANTDSYSTINTSDVKTVNPIVQREVKTTPNVYNLDGSLRLTPEEIETRKHTYNDNVDTRNLTSINNLSSQDFTGKAMYRDDNATVDTSNIYRVNLDEVINQQRLRNQQAVLREEEHERVVLDDHIGMVNQIADKRISAVDAHQQMYSELATEQLGHIGAILNESLYVQQSMDDTLRRIYKHLKGDEELPMGQKPTSGGEAAAERAKERQAAARRKQLAAQRQRSAPPVGMGKTG